MGWTKTFGNTAVVFQAPPLVPRRTAEQNVVHYDLNRVGLGRDMTKYAPELFNGMKQRIELARAFALSPNLLLLAPPRYYEDREAILECAHGAVSKTAAAKEDGDTASLEAAA